MGDKDCDTQLCLGLSIGPVREYYNDRFTSPLPAQSDLTPLSTVLHHRDSANDKHKECEVQKAFVTNEEKEGTKKKLRLSKEQTALLEELFKENTNLNTKQKQDLAKQLNLNPRQVEVWFQNKRARNKFKQIEMDCEMWKTCYALLVDENKRLKKELSKMKTLKQTTAAFPAAPLIMCPSCQSVVTSKNPTQYSTPLPAKQHSYSPCDHY